MFYDYAQLVDPNFRPKWKYPYSYDPFTIFRHKTETPEHSVYTDRMYKWDSKKFDALCTEYFGNTSQYFDNRDPKKIEAFLSAYLDKDVILCEIIEYCDVSSGYPTWRLDYKEKV